jgi:hypothetical protein
MKHPRKHILTILKYNPPIEANSNINKQKGPTEDQYDYNNAHVRDGGDKNVEVPHMAMCDVTGISPEAQPRGLVKHA